MALRATRSGDKVYRCLIQQCIVCLASLQTYEPALANVF